MFERGKVTRKTVPGGYKVYIGLGGGEWLERFYTRKAVMVSDVSYFRNRIKRGEHPAAVAEGFGFTLWR